MSAHDPLRDPGDPLWEIKDALAFPVSPDFCARVRQQVAAEPVRRRVFAGQRLALAAAVVLAAGIGLVTTLQHHDVDVAQGSGPRLVNATTTPVQSRPQPVAALEPVRALQPTARVFTSKTQLAYDTLVPDDQLRALDRLLAAMREGRATVPMAVSNDEVNDHGQRVLRALVIEPVTIELLAGTPAESIKNPGKDPNK
jgi:hypothetical protein